MQFCADFPTFLILYSFWPLFANRAKLQFSSKKLNMHQTDQKQDHWSASFLLFLYRFHWFSRDSYYNRIGDLYMPENDSTYFLFCFDILHILCVDNMVLSLKLYFACFFASFTTDFNHQRLADSNLLNCKVL